MPQFNYQGILRNGQKKTGILEADSRREVARKLAARGIRPSKITPRNASSGIDLKSFFKISLNKKSGKKIALNFLTKLLQLHQSGLPIGDAIKIMQQRVGDAQQKEVAGLIWHDLSEGSTLAMALKKHPTVFDESVIYAVEAGEASGSLKEILTNVVHNLKNQEALKKTIYGGLAYPIFITFVALSVVGLFLFYLLPRIQKMMTSLGGDMDLSAKLLIFFADASIYVIPGAIILAIGATIGINYWRRSEEGRYKTDGWTLQLPLLKTIFLNASICTSSNMMATLIASGVNTTEAMKLTENIIGNRVLRQRFQNCQKQINDGASISAAFKRNDFYPDLALDIISVGENTGDIGSSFNEIYTLYSEELTRRFKALTAILSTVALLFAFALVGVLAMSIVTSVLSFSKSLVG